MLPAPSVLLAFLAASFVLAATPGPAVFYIVTRSLSQGRAAGLASVAGVALGNLGNAIGASIGLAAVLAISSAAFMIVKYAGAAYLVYLGIQRMRNSRRAERGREDLQQARASRIFVDGFVVALLNPKTALFFGAFLPQFLSADTMSIGRSAVLGAIFVVVAASTDTMYALLAASVAPRLKRGGAQQYGRYLAGGALIGLGLFTAFGGSRETGHTAH